MKIKAFYSIPVGDHCYITSFVCPDRSQMDVFVFFKTADVMEGFFFVCCRSNGFEKKRYMRLADKKAMQEAAYKWSVEDM